MPVPVVLDTNFILLPFQRQLDLEGEVERLFESPHFFVVIGQVVDELSEMAAKQRKFSPAAKAALKFIEKKAFAVERGFGGKPDEAMLEYCSAKNGILCTMDAALQRKAKKRNIRVILLRGKSHLAWA